METLVYSDSVPNIDLDPLGGEETVIFDNYVFAMEGLYNLIVDIPLAVDDVTNNNIKKLGIGVDNTKPTSSHTLSPATPDGLNGWYVSDLTVTLDAQDGDQIFQSGVQEIIYKVNGVQHTIAGDHGSFKITEDGENIPVEYWAVDEVGNAESHHTFTVDMDQTKPEIEMTYEVTGGNMIQGWEFTFTADANDATSGMELVDFYFGSELEITIPGAGPTYQ